MRTFYFTSTPSPQNQGFNIPLSSFRARLYFDPILTLAFHALGIGLCVEQNTPMLFVLLVVCKVAWTLVKRSGFNDTHLDVYARYQVKPLFPSRVFSNLFDSLTMIGFDDP